MQISRSSFIYVIKDIITYKSLGPVFMLPSIISPSLTQPPIIAKAPPHLPMRFLEFFAANIRNAHRRRAYTKAARDFLTWCFGHGVRGLDKIAPIHVAAWIEMLGQSLAASSVKQRLAAIRHVFDWLVTGQAIATNPAASVRGPAHRALTGRTPFWKRPRRGRCSTQSTFQRQQGYAAGRSLA